MKLGIRASIVALSVSCSLAVPLAGSAAFGSWTTKAPYPSAVAYNDAAAVNGILYSVGGSNFGLAYSNLRSYNPATDAWAELAPLPPDPTFPWGDTGRYQGAAGALGGKFYLAGGWHHFPPLPTNALQAYDPATNSWSTRASMPHLSGCGAAASLNGKLYVYSPCNGYSGYPNLFDVYDPLTNSWTSLPGPPHEHAAIPAAGAIAGKFYIAGGFDGVSADTGALDIYDPTTNSWTSGAPLPTPRQELESGVLNGKFYAVGGRSSGTIVGTVEAYDPLTNTWGTAASMPLPTGSGGSDVIGNTLYTVAGIAPDNAVTATVEAFTPTDLNLTLSVNPSSATAGTPVTVSASITNNSTSSQSVTLQTSFTFVGLGGSFTFSGQPVTFTLAGGQTIARSTTFFVSYSMPKGAYTVTGTATDASGSVSSTATLTVN